MAFMPKAINIVPNTLAAMRREGDWERREEGGDIFFFFFPSFFCCCCLCVCVVRYIGNVSKSWCWGRLLVLLVRR